MLKEKLIRKTYAEVNLKNIELNIKKIKEKYNMYQYFFAVVKANAYGRGSLKVAEAVIKGGSNYLAVAILEEALELREKFKDIPILVLGIIDKEYVEECVKNNITISVGSLEYLNEIKDYNIANLKVHIQVNTGMNRFGVTTGEEVEKIIEKIEKCGAIVEGIYTHIYNASIEEDYKKQIQKFKSILDKIEYKKIPMIHVASSDAMSMYEKPAFVNGCRMGNIMYGILPNESIKLNSTVKLYSEVIKINHLQKGEKVRIWWNIRSGW